MKVGKWITLVVVLLLLLFSVGCATGSWTNATPPTKIGVPFDGGGYQRVTA